ncbi:hypothetical protein GF345_03490 [Candidatus Woesearchaeota archaeon]|nr:hypothetical protein [Candidatus Woesearchaeota archaeon]
MAIGIYYLRFAESLLLLIPVVLISSIFLVPGLAMLINRIKRVKMRKLLMNRGRKITAKTVSVEMNQRYSVNGVHPYYIIAEKDGEKYYSDNIWFNPQYVPDEVKVVIDQDNHKNHAIDLTWLKTDKKMVTEKFRIVLFD